MLLCHRQKENLGGGPTGKVRPRTDSTKAPPDVDGHVQPESDLGVLELRKHVLHVEY